jgi:Tfp pilus assembly protein PilP
MRRFGRAFSLMILLGASLVVALPSDENAKKALANVSVPASSIGNGADAEVPHYKYEAKGRRDPFRTLDVTNTIQAAAVPVVRPPGLKGQLVSEIKLVGIVKSKGTLMAIAEGYRGKTYFVRERLELYDGRVLEIKNDAVVFSQSLTDSFGKKISQQVIKKLYPTRGEGTNAR